MCAARVGSKKKAGSRKGVKMEQPNTIGRRYYHSKSAMRALTKLGPIYGSKGRAVQVATELLIRMKKPIAVNTFETSEKNPMVAHSYKLTPRTVDLIERLAEKYGTRANVFAACAQVLKDEA
jgi:hypothetical protein